MSSHHLTPRDRDMLLQTLSTRYAKHSSRHRGIEWAQVLSRLESHPLLLWSISEMERTGGEPDVIGQDEHTGQYLYVDCSPESPSARRSLCYDQAAWESRKVAKPAGSALAASASMGATLLTEDEYHALQRTGPYDLKTSSWLLTPPDVRERGGAIFGDRRYDRVFIYHNGAESYYAARGFRCIVRI